MTKRLWIPNTHPNREVVNRAVEWLDSVTPALEPAGLVVGTLSWLRGGDLEAVLGDSMIRLLTSNRACKLPSGGRLEAISMHGNRGRVAFHGPLLLVYADKKRLDFADQIDGATEILVVPWQHKDVADWVAQWGAVQLGGMGSEASRLGLGLNQVVCAALRTILGTRLLIPTEGRLRSKDKAPVLNMLELLHRNGETFAPDQLRSWAITEAGCSPAFADDLAAIAANVIAGHAPLSPAWWNDQAIASWRARAAGSAFPDET